MLPSAGSSLLIPTRFRGPTSSGNGGWTAGTLAASLRPAPGTAVTVRLLAPPPLETPMPVAAGRERDGARSATAVLRDRPVAVATETDAVPVAVPPVALDVARDAERGYRGSAAHPFPQCFVCGPERGADGYRLSPGPLPADPSSTACTWTPAADLAADGVLRVGAPAVWAALDCPGGWSLDLLGRPMVLGSITVAVLAAPPVGEPCVVVGRADAVHARRAGTRASLYTADGSLLATARHVWVAVDPADFG